MSVRAQVSAGVCGFETSVEAQSPDGVSVVLMIESTCPKVRALARELQELNAFEEILQRPLAETTPVRLAAQHGLHASCLVPVGVLKAVEAAASLALPATSTIAVVKDA
ncbi:MAG: hypothetical protein JXA09_03245 [Anaerolineae bacterium]|nr:hypothetical protein [Anaerolineae bacterium]